MLEAAERNGLSFPALMPETNARLSEVLGVGTSLGNPLDAGFAALSSPEAYFRCVELLLTDPNIDVLILQEELPPAPRLNNKVENLKVVDRMVANGTGKPVAVVSMISYMFTEHTKSFRAELKHLPVLQEVDRAIKAVGRAGRYGALRALEQQQPSTTAARDEKPDVAPILCRHTSAGDGLSVLNEADSKALLRAYGIAAPRERIAANVEDAVRAANDVGYPVVLKVLSADVTHKSDIGGIILGITRRTSCVAPIRGLPATSPTPAPALSSTRCWSPSRCPAAWNLCSACSATRRSGRSSCSAPAACCWNCTRT
jgi:acetyltransferase